MAITTYSELQAAVQAWLARSDLAANVPDFIALFEAAANRRLRVRQMQAAVNLVTVNGSAALPSDYLEWKRVTWLGTPTRELSYVDPDWSVARYPAFPAANLAALPGLPNDFTIELSALRIRPVDDTGTQLVYYQKIPALSDAAPTNWLLGASPDAYLAGALAEAKTFVEDFDGAQVWLARRDTAFAEIERLDRATQARASIRPTGPTP
jgi:hypothetical protein